MMDADDAPYAAGRLVQWGLRNGAHPKRNDEYQALLARYLDRLEFREVVQRFAEGLELEILEASTEHGMVLAPLPGSAFATQASDYRPSSNEDTRLLDGLVQVAIAATVYPRAMDLLGDPTTVRNPVTVAEIEETLRQLVNRLDEAAKQQPDPVPEEAGGLYEAWRVYKHRQAQRSTKDQRASPSARTASSSTRWTTCANNTASSTKDRSTGPFGATRFWFRSTRPAERTPLSSAP
ncbi:hypothetical protein [Deinococcus multiflagellatus]|uniref:Uncharacterized protein n=1 Tax=Deinococcus multiflagellatus TaxID=1656887 RepID=A0ABW1ZIX2_9DEIO